MGSATREAQVATRAAVVALEKADLSTGEQILRAGRIIGDSAPLLAALVDAMIEPADRASIVDSLFSTYSDTTRSLLGTAVSNHWSNGTDLLAGIEELGFRVLAKSAPASVSIEDELFVFGTAVNSDSAFELAVSSKLGTGEAKAALVHALVDTKASGQTVAILEHLVQQPRGRRIAELLEDAASAVASERGFAIATVTTAASIEKTQLTRLTKALSASYGREIHVNHVVDPTVVGGIRVQIGDDIIDGTIASRLAELRLQMAS